MLGEAYPDGSRAVYGSSTTHLFKALAGPRGLEVVASAELARRRFTPHYNLFVLRGGDVVVQDRKARRYLRFADARLGDPRSPLRLVGAWTLPDGVRGAPTQVNVTFDGHVVALTDAGVLVAVRADQLGRVPDPPVAVFDTRPAGGDLSTHNAFAVDETGGLFVVSHQAMTRVTWDGRAFRLAWRAPYDFLGPGCAGRAPTSQRRGVLMVARGRPCTGSGTTPTLLGPADGADDRLVVVVDGHRPRNHLVAFWRDRVPDDWAGLPGLDRRVAAVTALPYSTPDGRGFTAENSPTAWGYTVATAQYNGLRPPCDPVRGVQQLRWDPRRRAFAVTWATDRVNLNNVLTYSAGSGLVYGTGRQPAGAGGCAFHFYALDWATGAVRVDLPLGSDRAFNDPGDQVTVLEDRSVVFGTSRGLVRVRPAGGGGHAAGLHQSDGALRPRRPAGASGLEAGGQHDAVLEPGPSLGDAADLAVVPVGPHLR